MLRSSSCCTSVRPAAGKGSTSQSTHGGASVCPRVLSVRDSVTLFRVATASSDVAAAVSLASPRCLLPAARPLFMVPWRGLVLRLGPILPTAPWTGPPPPSRYAAAIPRAAAAPRRLAGPGRVALVVSPWSCRPPLAWSSRLALPRPGAYGLASALVLAMSLDDCQPAGLPSLPCAWTSHVLGRLSAQHCSASASTWFRV